MRTAPWFVVTSFLLPLLAAGQLFAADWTGWRGPHQNGVSDETGLISKWSPEGENLLWRADFTGRSTPLVHNGRVFVNGRRGEGINRQATVAAFDALSGRLIWERPFNVYHTTVPFNRVGWSSPGLDSETGNIFIQGVAGTLLALDRDGQLVWQHSMAESFGRFSGYGGRTPTPLVFENLVIVNNVNTSWGKQGPPRNRYYAFDKRTGDVVWTSTPSGPDHDKNTYSNPIIADINGTDLMIAGNADGSIYGLKPRTGEKVWEFKLSKRGINSSVVVDGTRVYAAHSEENVDESKMGRVVAIDATGVGDITKTHELWRVPLQVGHSSPSIKDGVLYVIDNSANLHALEAENGEELWEQNVGTVGKGSPVWADDKLYVTEVNGRFHIIEANRSGARMLDSDEIKTPDGRFAEIYGSPAIANGRVYFTSEEGVYGLGRKGAPAAPATSMSSPGTRPALPQG